jgi:hypothetical protein
MTTPLHTPPVHDFCAPFIFIRRIQSYPSYTAIKSHQDPRNEAIDEKEREWLLFFNIIKLLPKDLVHSEHMHLLLLEHQLHLLVAPYLALIVWVLQVAGFNVLPYLLDGLGARELFSLALAQPIRKQREKVIGRSEDWTLTVGSPTKSASGALK